MSTDKTKDDAINDIKPAPTDTEPSRVYDPFETARKLDEASLAAKKATDDTNPPAPKPDDVPPAAPPKDDNPPAPSDPNPPAPKPDDAPPTPDPDPSVSMFDNLTPEQKQQVIYLAHIGQQHLAETQSPDYEIGQKAIADHRAKIAADEKAKADSDPNEYWVNSFNEQFGDFSPLFKQIIDKRIAQLAEKVIADKYGSFLDESRLSQAERVQREVESVRSNAVKYLGEKFGVPEDQASAITSGYLAELAQKYPKFDRETIERELKLRILDEIVPEFVGQTNKHISDLNLKLSQIPPNPSTPPNSSTAAAAARIYDTDDAKYHIDGGIPAGGDSNGNAKDVSEADKAWAFFNK